VSIGNNTQLKGLIVWETDQSRFPSNTAQRLNRHHSNLAVCPFLPSSHGNIGALQLNQSNGIDLLFDKLSREQPFSGKMLLQHCIKSVAYPLVRHVRQTS